MPGPDPWSSVPPEVRAEFDAQTIAAIQDEGLVDRLRRLDRRAKELRFPNPDEHKEAIEAAEVLLRVAAGLNIDQPHGKDTPRRFAEMLRELTTPPEIKWTTFPNDGMDEMIVTEAIPFHSLCEHHVIPFLGEAYIGYVPNELIAGLSKFARVVKHFAARLQVQERLTMQIAEYLQKQLEPRGVAVVMRAEHLCMTIRGAQVPGAMTYTAAMKGVFSDHTRTAKAEFLAEIARSK